MQFFKFDHYSIFIGCLIFWVLSFLFFFVQLFYPQCCDANSYLAIARRYNSEGIVEVQNTLRTFAYPWLLSIFIKLSNLLNIPQFFFIFLIQSIAYYCFITYTKKSFESRGDKSNWIFIALSANIFLIPYLSLTLTDGIYTIISVLILVALINVEQSDLLKDKGNEKSILMIFLLTGLVMVIRPAAIWLLIPLVYLISGLILKKKVSLPTVGYGLILGAVPLLFQATINVINFKQFTFFPIDDLGSDQIRWGIENIKYATWLGNAQPEQNFYTSKNLINLPVNPADLNLAWYFLNIVDAVKLLTFKFVAAFDFDFLMPYPYHETNNSWVPSLFSFSILWFGLFGTFFHAITSKILIIGNRFMPLIVLISWGAVSLISALELRFTLPLLTYFIIISVYTIKTLLKKDNRKALIGAAIGWGLSLPIFFSIAFFVRAQSAINLH